MVSNGTLKRKLLERVLGTWIRNLLFSFTVLVKMARKWTNKPYTMILLVLNVWDI